MHKVEELNKILGNIDIYLLDQIMKGRYLVKDKILDAGCGSGRNLVWFHQNEYDLYGVDANLSAVEAVRQAIASDSEHFRHETIEDISFKNNFFDHVICNAVLHFAHNEQHFLLMFQRLIDTLKPGGCLFIRMTSDIGIEGKAIRTSYGLHLLPDGSTRFLLTRSLVNQLVKKHQLYFIEPIKSVNVNDLRSMTTLILGKS